MTRSAGGAGGAMTVRPIEVVPVRPSLSDRLIGSVLSPVVVLTATVVERLKTLSPAVTSPLVPLSSIGATADPPIDERSAATEIVVPGAEDVIVAVRSVALPSESVDGF